MNTTQNKGERRKEQLEEYCNPEIKVSELRIITDTKRV
jgi:hypothetical protein